MKLFKLFSRITFRNTVWNKNYGTAPAFSSLSLVEPIRLAYKTYGETEVENGVRPLIIMHGIFGSKSNWQTISNRLQKVLKPKRKIICVDARNHGESPHSNYHSYPHLAADVVELMKQLNIERTCLFGHSMGGRAMMYTALLYPNLIDKLIVGDITPFSSPSALKPLNYIIQVLQGVDLPSKVSLETGRLLVAEELMKSIRNPETILFLLTNLKKDQNGQFFWRVNLDAIESNMENVVTFPQNILHTKQYRGPVMFIGGSKSDYITNSDMPRIKKIFPNAILKWVDSGHVIQYEKPDDVVSLVASFLND